jgi:vacuolar-type H+-ATPase subunit I/STV1
MGHTLNASARIGSRLLAALTLGTLIIAPSISAQTVESVGSQKDRCLRKLEKVERNLDNTNAAVDRIKRLRQAAQDAEAQQADAFLEKAANKIEYTSNRVERCRNQLEKIESDLANVSTGNQCPKCISSNVNLFCRQIESIYSENADLMSEIVGFERTLRASASVHELMKRTDNALAAVDSQTRAGSARLRAAAALQEKARKALAANNLDAAMGFALEAGDSVAGVAARKPVAGPLDDEIARVSGWIEEARKAIGAGNGAKSSVVLEKAEAHFEKAKALYAQGKTDDSRTELAIAGKFAAAAINLAERKE